MAVQASMPAGLDLVGNALGAGMQAQAQRGIANTQAMAAQNMQLNEQHAAQQMQQRQYGHESSMLGQQGDLQMKLRNQDASIQQSLASHLTGLQKQINEHTFQLDEARANGDRDRFMPLWRESEALKDKRDKLNGARQLWAAAASVYGVRSSMDQFVKMYTQTQGVGAAHTAAQEAAKVRKQHIITRVQSMAKAPGMDMPTLASAAGLDPDVTKALTGMGGAEQAAALKAWAEKVGPQGVRDAAEILDAIDAALAGQNNPVPGAPGPATGGGVGASIPNPGPSTSQRPWWEMALRLAVPGSNLVLPR